MGNYRDTYFAKNSSNYGWYRCVRCGRSFRKGDIDIDHIIPQSRGGSDSEWNLQCLCVHCNRSKRDDMSDSFRDRVSTANRIITREVQNNPFSGLFKKKP